MASIRKTCTKCLATKSLDSFYWTSDKTKKRRRHSVCQACRRLQFSAWAKTPGGRAAKKAGVLRREFGLSQLQYDAMLAAQGDVCASCGEPETVIRRGKLATLCVDHDHKTGRVRGLLCSACNVGLGSFRDDPERLRRAASYLEGRRVAGAVLAGLLSFGPTTQSEASPPVTGDRNGQEQRQQQEQGQQG